MSLPSMRYGSVWLTSSLLADIALDCRWADDAERVIAAKADLKFVKAFEGCDFRMSYILVADGLTGEDAAGIRATTIRVRRGSGRRISTISWMRPTLFRGWCSTMSSSFILSRRVCRRVCLRVSGRIRRCPHSVSLSLDDACNPQRGDACP